ncbi:hypothetical protein [Kitasatospora sp. NPDC096204]|uniref:hypothetical protein n=1 Tax=Kitasatospora sp. NPDC096204 TaxID=3364094 RepID=UPI003819A2DE
MQLANQAARRRLYTDAVTELMACQATVDSVIALAAASPRRTPRSRTTTTTSGRIAIWLRWAGPAPKTVPAGVLLIHLTAVPTSRNGGRRAYTLTKQAPAAAAVTIGR